VNNLGAALRVHSPTRGSNSSGEGAGVRRTGRPRSRLTSGRPVNIDVPRLQHIGGRIVRRRQGLDQDPRDSSLRLERHDV